MDRFCCSKFCILAKEAATFTSSTLSLARSMVTRFRCFWMRPASRSEEHTSELQSLMRISYAVFCLKKKIKHNTNNYNIISTSSTPHSHGTHYQQIQHSQTIESITTSSINSTHPIP